jgi:hypothetical protein
VAGGDCVETLFTLRIDVRYNHSDDKNNMVAGGFLVFEFAFKISDRITKK